MANTNRTALLLRCSVQEAQQIRAAARMERRTVSGFILHCIENKLRIRTVVEERIKRARTGVEAKQSRPAPTDRAERH
jgi:uncharacterized protein (DUF1778 family)